jgi:hypothetical protein
LRQPQRPDPVDVPALEKVVNVMRSIRGLVAAVIVLLTVPVAIGVALATGGGAEPIIHFGIGAGMLLLAVAAFDFGLPRWIAWYGAATAGAFGGIFVLQGIADAIGEPNLWHFAFSVLGQQPERLLPELIVGWFVALLVLGSQGRTRIFGTIVLGALIAAEVITIGGPVLGVDVADIKLRWLLPFVWLLFESAKRAAPTRTIGRLRVPSVAESRG